MEIIIKINGQAMSVAVTVEVYEYLDQAEHKEENLAHEQRRHQDMRELDEYIIATECSHIHIPTPEEILCHRETTCELMAVLASCTEVQQERFLLYALQGMSFSEIAMYIASVSGGSLLIGTISMTISTLINNVYIGYAFSSIYWLYWNVNCTTETLLNPFPFLANPTSYEIPLIVTFLVAVVLTLFTCLLVTKSPFYFADRWRKLICR